VRSFLRVHRKRLTATAATVAVTSALVTGGVLTLTSTTAAAQAPVITMAPDARMAPITSAEKAERLNAAAEAQGRAMFAQLKAAEAAKVMTIRAKVVSLARAQLGDRYSAGATGPSAFDCSGLTKYVFKKAAGKNLPHQSHAQYAKVKRIKLKDAKPGDLVFFFRGGAHHVGIYIGNHKMIDAVGYGSGVRVSPIAGSWWSRTYSGVGRILPA
jgi:cell wall-associated NlpC family hydrolase